MNPKNATIREQDLDRSSIHLDHHDRHSPHLQCAATARQGEPFLVTIYVDSGCSHPDNEDHHISSVALYDGARLLGEANFPCGTRGGDTPRARLEVSFMVVPTDERMHLRAMAFCTQHGLWQGDTREIPVLN